MENLRPRRRIRRASAHTPKCPAAAMTTVRPLA